MTMWGTCDICLSLDAIPVSEIYIFFYIFYIYMNE